MKTCSTCRHWERWEENTCGACRGPMLTYYWPKDAQVEGGQEFKDEGDDRLTMITGPDFGCVNHESK